MGDVKVHNLRDIEENPTVISEYNLQDVRIGDRIEELIVLFGRNYSIVHDDYYTAIVYDNLSIYLDRYGYYVNEEMARDANMIIDFIEFSIDEKYTLLVRFDENNTIVGISMGSSEWFY